MDLLSRKAASHDSSGNGGNLPCRRFRLLLFCRRCRSRSYRRFRGADRIHLIVIFYDFFREIERRIDVGVAGRIEENGLR